MSQHRGDIDNADMSWKHALTLFRILMPVWSFHAGINNMCANLVLHIERYVIHKQWSMMESKHDRDPSHLECWTTYQQINHVRSNWEAAEHPHVYCNAAVKLALRNELCSGQIISKHSGKNWQEHKERKKTLIPNRHNSDRDKKLHLNKEQM